MIGLTHILTHIKNIFRKDSVIPVCIILKAVYYHLRRKAGIGKEAGNGFLFYFLIPLC